MDPLEEQEETRGKGTDREADCALIEVEPGVTKIINNRKNNNSKTKKFREWSREDVLDIVRNKKAQKHWYETHSHNHSKL